MGVKLPTDYAEVGNGKYNGSLFITSNKKYLVSDENMFIGRTKDFVFLKSKITGVNTVIPVVQIVEEKLISNPWKYEKIYR